jgi:hypothetical protein
MEPGEAWMLVELQAREWAFRFGNPMSQYRTPILIGVQPFNCALLYVSQIMP